MRHMFAIIVGMVALFSLSTATSIILGRVTGESRLQGLRAAFEPGSCEQPCFHNIEVDKTSGCEAWKNLQADPAITMSGQDNCIDMVWKTTVGSTVWDGQAGVRGESSTITWINLQAEPASQAEPADSDLRLADAFVLWGTPEAIECAIITNPRGLSHPSGALYGMTLTFRNGIQVYVSRFAAADSLLAAPEWPITGISYQRYMGYISSLIYPWPGFLSIQGMLARHMRCQLPD